MKKGFFVVFAALLVLSMAYAVVGATETATEDYGVCSLSANSGSAIQPLAACGYRCSWCPPSRGYSCTISGVCC